MGRHFGARPNPKDLPEPTRPPLACCEPRARRGGGPSSRPRSSRGPKRELRPTAIARQAGLPRLRRTSASGRWGTSVAGAEDHRRIRARASAPSGLTHATCGRRVAHPVRKDGPAAPTPKGEEGGLIEDPLHTWRPGAHVRFRDRWCCGRVGRRRLLYRGYGPDLQRTVDHEHPRSTNHDGVYIVVQPRRPM